MAQGVPGRLRRQIILTFRHYTGGRSSAKRTSRLYPRRNPWYSLSEAESTAGQMVLSGIPRKKSPLTPPGIDPRTVQLVVQRLNHYATFDCININNILVKEQFGFRTNSSTEIAAYILINNILLSLNNDYWLVVYCVTRKKHVTV